MRCAYTALDAACLFSPLLFEDHIWFEAGQLLTDFMDASLI